MARSYFALFPGVQPPSSFQAMIAPELLTISDIWEAARKAPGSLLFRVRSESDPGASVTSEDRLESCVGVVDAVTRWRAVWAMVKPMISAIQHPQLRAACATAMQFSSSQHPAAVNQDQRLQVSGGIVQIADGLVEGLPKPGTFDIRVAYNVARLVHADNDIEAAYYVPFRDVLNPFNPDTERQEFQGRAATVETMSGAVLLAAAAERLGERAPQWIAFVPAKLDITGGSALTPRDRGEDKD